jgi:ribosomal protein S18 acetylase RimI-like enzyme
LGTLSLLLMSDFSLTLRPITASDLPFLQQVYASTRESEMTLISWSEAEKQAFLESQFTAQHAHYQTYYVKACFDVIERDGQPIGRLYVDHWEREIRIVDIALLPEYRGQGTGAHLIGQIQSQAAAVRKTVSIHVEKYNPAYKLYDRLGFVKTSETGVYDLLVWNPSI